MGVQLCPTASMNIYISLLSGMIWILLAVRCSVGKGCQQAWLPEFGSPEPTWWERTDSQKLSSDLCTCGSCKSLCADIQTHDLSLRTLLPASLILSNRSARYMITTVLHHLAKTSSGFSSTIPGSTLYHSFKAHKTPCVHDQRYLWSTVKGPQAQRGPVTYPLTPSR